MEEFKELENLWQQSETKIPTKNTNISKIKNNRMKLKNTYTKGAILLLVTGIFILGLMISLDSNLKTIPIILSMVIISTVCFLQAFLMIFTAKKISKIDETQTPSFHLKQWQNFREFQKKQRHWNMPIYYLFLGTAIGIYMYELLKNTDLWKMVLAFAITYSWMLFAYFYLGKKEIKKQDAKLDGIISELKSLENQFQ
ncbi:hypothetical protein [Kaistella jeonii]|uniref:Uncharacterized protein n=1 Tax=Kaistella jeonii TaxID=266749 RepID=A0A0C1FJR9_9FLAO|nr:hypothetical protein [Kaistella jeonii]KIA88159.1 hypothetical protein OA86_12475 [Kaistella jeonii]SFC29603.1 hypothetical protein SAMN05421876_11263 [Kaistella jeonii]VEI96877.1 Uncharacterised protein [Kaistella jeonii]